MSSANRFIVNISGNHHSIVQNPALGGPALVSSGKDNMFSSADYYIIANGNQTSDKSTGPGNKKIQWLTPPCDPAFDTSGTPCVNGSDQPIPGPDGVVDNTVANLSNPPAAALYNFGRDKTDPSTHGVDYKRPFTLGNVFITPP